MSKASSLVLSAETKLVSAKIIDNTYNKRIEYLKINTVTSLNLKIIWNGS